MTDVISASRDGFGEVRIVSSLGLERQWLRSNEPLTMTGTALAELPLFSDDYVPVERMISPLLFTPQGV